MRKCISILLSLIILFSSTISGFALKKSENEFIDIFDSLDGRVHTVKVVNLIIGGNDVISDVPAILFEGRTLVPVRFIGESLGAEVTWNQDTKEATIKAEDKEIILKINSPKVKVNGKEYNLPDNVPAKLIAYKNISRTMVPLRFVSEQLGMEVGWIGETMTATIDFPLQEIRDINFIKDKFPEIRIKTTGKVEYSAFLLQGSSVGGQDRLVIDIPNTKLNIIDNSKLKANGLAHIDINSTDIASVRASQFKVDPYQTRIVVDLNKVKGYDILYQEESKELIIRLINTVDGIRVEKVYDVDTVVIQTSEEPTYNIMFLEGRIVVDVLNSLMRYRGSSIDVNRGGIKAIRYSQFQPDHNYSPDDKISRVVVDLQEGISSEEVYIEHMNNEIFLYILGNPLDKLEYFKEDIMTAKLALNIDEKGEYRTDYSKKDNMLTLIVNKDLVQLKDLDIEINDNIVSYVKVDEERDKENYYIYIKLEENTTVIDETKGKASDRIEFTFINDKIKDSKYKNMLVVVDPGHGGTDPGAISPNIKLKEKDVVLDVSLKLRNLLEANGFKVYMTRDNDEYIGLYDRATIANELGAHAFVSIHANAHDDRTVEGIQVLYYPDDGSRGNYKFATYMMDALTKGLDAANKGIIQRPNLVVTRETKMPAVLLELGFLTNSKEENLLNTDSYRTLAAEAILDGLIKYFDKEILK